MRTVAVVLALALSGCSFVLVDRPPPAASVEGPPPDCSDSRTPVQLDVLMMASSFGFAAVYSMFMGIAYGVGTEPEAVHALPIGGALGVGAGYLVSGVYGGRRVARCRELLESYWDGRLDRATYR